MKPENMRRLRLGDVQRLLRKRCGNSLPDDDAGREYLYELLLLGSLAYNPERTMRSMIEIWAPWMDKAEADQAMDAISRSPSYLRKPKARLLGERLRLTDQERQELAIVTIRPVDMTDEQLQQRRKSKDAARKWRKRRAAKMKDREAWLRNCKSRTKPWERYGIGRRQWERRKAAERKAKTMSQVHVAGVSAVKSNTVEDRLASFESQQRGNSRKQGAARKEARKRRRAA